MPKRGFQHFSFALAIAGSIAIFGLTPSRAGAQTQVNVTSDEVPGEVVVRYKHQLSHPDTQKSLSQLQGKAVIHSSIHELNIHHLRITDGSSHHDLIQKLNRDSAVQYAEPNFYVRLNQNANDPNLAASSGAVQMQSISGGGSYGQNFANVHIAQAWTAMNTPTYTPVVAVIDTGIDYNHNVFTSSSAVWTNSAEIPSNGIDDDGNGFIDDVRGWNFYSGNNNPYDDNGHGTHVSGIVIGVAQNILASSLQTSLIKIMPLKFMGSDGTGTTSAAVSAIYYAANNGAKVINNSWGGSSYSQSLHDALTYAYSRGLVISSAAGNYSTNDDSTPMYPASLAVPSQITVAASDNSDNLAYFSSFGPSTVHVGSPGLTIYSTWPGNSFAYLSGTSMAAPFVAGLAALASTQASQLTGYQVKQMVTGGATAVSALHSLTVYGSRVDALGAVQMAQANTRTPASQPSYSAVPPAGVSTGSSSAGGAGCGTIAASAASSLGLGGSGMGPTGATLLVLMLLPLAVWFAVDAQAAKKVSRRRFERFRLETAVQFLVEGRQFEGRLATIGLGGLSFSADAGLEKGGDVVMMIAGPEGQEGIEVAGRIVWSENSKAYGVQFGPLADGVQQEIRRWTSFLSKS